MFPGVLVPSADIEGVAVGGMTNPLNAGLFYNDLTHLRRVHMRRCSQEGCQWELSLSMSQHLIMKLSKPWSVFNIR
jgi:hypothetical protein